MEFEGQIKGLLASDSTDDTVLALQLMQSQWKWSQEKAFLYLFDHFWETEAESLTLNLGNLRVRYHLNFTMNNNLSLGWDVNLIFSMRRNQSAILDQQTLKYGNLPRYKHRYLDYYETFIREHFELQIPKIARHLKL